MERFDVELKKLLRGDVSIDAATLTKMSRDTSIFSRRPRVIVYPKDTEDLTQLVTAIGRRKDAGEDISLTARSAGTDMSGGPLTTSVLAVFTKYFTKIQEIRADEHGGYAVVEPGVYYRDFEKKTLAQGRLILPPYPASRELCAIGGMVNNNAGGERTLEYGKTEDYVEEVEVVLSDGSTALFKELTLSEVEEKKKLQTLEGSVYRELVPLVLDNWQAIRSAKPAVSKNSAGYALWNVYDEEKETINLAKLICGAQGTLALMTKARLRLVKEQGFRSMLVVFLNDLDALPEIVERVLAFTPESFESYDDKTFSLALRFLPQMLSQMGLAGALRLGFSFVPEILMMLRGGVPKLVLMAEFSEDTYEAAYATAQRASVSLAHLGLATQVLKNEKAAQKYWKVRRESFNLLRKNVHGMAAAAFIDDIVVPPRSYPEFLPELDALLKEYEGKFIYTIAGHIGNGNFHIIPLVDLSKPQSREMILELTPRVYDLVAKYKGSNTGEHNDGIIRTPYLEKMFDPNMLRLFSETKRIFDPKNIFNPGKKVGGTIEDIRRDMITSL